MHFRPNVLAISQLRSCMGNMPKSFVSCCRLILYLPHMDGHVLGHNDHLCNGAVAPALHPLHFTLVCTSYVCR